MLDKFYQQEMQHVVEFRQPLWAERRFAVPLTDQVQLIGFFDRIDVQYDASSDTQAVVLIEYKTKLDDAHYAKHELQLLMYMLAYHREFGYWPRLGYLQSFTSGKVTVVNHDLSKLEQTEQFVLQTVEKMVHDTSFEAKPSVIKCKYCPFATICTYKLDTIPAAV